MENAMDLSNKEYELVQRFKTITPEEFLKEFSDVPGSIKDDFEALEYIRKYNLPDSVLNALINLTFMYCDTKMSISFMDKMANYWTRMRVKTPVEAIEISKLHYKKYREWAKDAKKEDRETKQLLKLNKIERTRLKAIELAASSSSMSEEDLGKFVREMFKS